MSINDCPRLCGGTFFTLLLEARGQRTAKRDNTYGATDGLSQPDLLVELIRMIKPAFNPPIKNATLKKNVGGYRRCEDNGGTYLSVVFKSNNDTKAFQDRFERSYDSVLGMMSALVARFLAEDKGEWLVKALIETVMKDNNIEEGQTFYIDGREVPKSEISGISRISLPSFLLGIWHYVVMNVDDNSVGKNTFSNWHKKKGETNSEWMFNYEANVGGSVTHKIAVIFPAVMVSSTTANQPKDDDSQTNENSEAYHGYLEFMKSKYSTIKTLLFDNDPVPFYDFYVCNDILSRFGALGSEEAPIVPHLKDEKQDAFFSAGLYEKSLYEPKRYKASLSLLTQLYRFAIFTGIGGLGKSMLMRHLLLSAVDRFNELKLLPILVPLKEYSESGIELYGQILSIVTNHITQEQLEAKLEAGECLLLLDGMDEVKNSDRRKIKQELDSLTDKYPKNYFYISSRPDDRFVSYERFHLSPLQPFTKEQALQLIEKITFRPDEPRIKERFRIEVEQRLFETHKEFVENPLLVTIMLMRHEQYSHMPEKMHIFYEEAFDVLARRHDANKGYERSYKTGLSKDEFIKYFSEICFRSYKDERLTFTGDEFKEYFKKLKTDIDADDFLYDISYNLCMLLQEGRTYHFVHRSFQEYFSAVFIKEQDNKHLKKLGEFFEKHYDGEKSDNTLAMLYDMKQSLVETFIFTPFLEELFEKCKGEDGYWCFLAQIYSGFYYNGGLENEPDSKLYGFIKDKFPIEYSIGFDELPSC
ncbi:MAG: NACHT domain-containing protein, partial [Bacillota bacterium]